MKIEKLTEWNPWWESKKFISNFEGIPREQYDLLIKSIKIKEITIITGIRRSGKSTLMYQMISNLLKSNTDPTQILFINLEDNKINQNNLDEIYNSYKENLNPDKKAYIFLDEIHKKKEWEIWIRKKYDQKTNDKFVISGSCSYLLKKEYSTLLTGRNITFEVFPLTFYEFLKFNKINIDLTKIKKNIILEKTKNLIKKKLNTYLKTGGFPESILKQKEYKQLILKQYFDDILYKDIIDRHNINSQKAKDLSLFLMTNFTSLVSLRNIRNALQISYDTIKDYITYFKDAFLFFTLDYFSYSIKEQKSFASKIYCIDNGLRNSVSFKFSKDEGKLAENIVFIELKRQKKEVFYWKKKKEVDFVIKTNNNKLNCINVSFTNKIEKREIEALLEFKKEFNKTNELIIITKDLEKIENKIKFIPLWKWLLTSK